MKSTATRYSGLLAALLFLSLPAASLARSEYLDSFNGLYGTTGSRLDSCDLCHTSNNGYFDDFTARPHSGTSAVTAFQAIEGLDSDSDGFANKAEIDALKFPGNAADKPAVPPPPALTLLSPNGGEALPTGSVFSINWQAVDSAAGYDLAYSLNNGRNWVTIDTGVAGTSYDWTVPAPPKNKRGLVRVTARGAGGAAIATDRSDARFAIVVVELTSPGAGDVLAGGGQHTITWTANDTVRPVDSISLTYTLNGGRTWRPVGPPIPGTLTEFTWEVPSPRGTRTKCKVKVVLRDLNGRSVGADTGDPFTIQ